MAGRLEPDEQVVFDLHPHVRQLVAPVGSLLLLAAGGGYLLAIVPPGSAQRAGRVVVGLVLVGLLVRWVVVPVLAWRGTRYLLTDRRLMVRQGVLSRRGKDVPLWRVTDVSFTASFRQRLFGSGTLVVETAGERGQLELSDVPDVEEAQRQLYQAVERSSGRDES